MDRFLYVAMTGARQAQVAQAATNHNLANASTVGFKATLAGSQYVPVSGPGFDDARAYAVTVGQGTDFTPGPMIATGNALDVAVEGDGWIAVQAPDGSEAYTRAGNFRIDPFGLLTTASGEPVLGEGGPIAIPQFEKLDIGADGTITIQPVGSEPNALAVVERIRLVTADPSTLTRGEDGLMRVGNGGTAVPDASVKLASGVLEGSNVNMVGALVDMIEQSRAFEMHIKMIGTAKDIDQTSMSLFRLG